jgi:hypothetical protein
MSAICIFCCDMPEGKWCRCCGRNDPNIAPPKAESEGVAKPTLGDAVKAARGGDAPIGLKGYA